MHHQRRNHASSIAYPDRLFLIPGSYMHLEIGDIISLLMIIVYRHFVTLRLTCQLSQMYRGQLPSTVFIPFDPRNLLEGKEGPFHHTLCRLILVDLATCSKTARKCQEIIRTLGPGGCGVKDIGNRKGGLYVEAYIFRQRKFNSRSET